MSASTNRADWRKALAGDDVNAAITAMANLLNADEGGLEPEAEDVAASIATMERFGPAGQSAMEEYFETLAARIPDVSVPVLLRLLQDDPVGYGGTLAAATLGEIVMAHGVDLPIMERAAVVGALTGAVDAAVGRPIRDAADALAALQAWSLHERVPEAGPAVRRWLEAAVFDDLLSDALVHRARSILEAAGQEAALSEIRERALEAGADEDVLEALEA